MCGLGPTFAERPVLVGVCPDICIEDGLSIMEIILRKVQGLGLQVLYKEDDKFRCFANSMIALAFVPPTFLRVAWRGLKGEGPVFANDEEFF